MEKAAFTVYIPGLIRYYFEKVYEEICENQIPHKWEKETWYDEENEEWVSIQHDLCEGTMDQELAKAEIYPLFDLIACFNEKPDSEIENDFEEYIRKNRDDIIENEVTIDEEDFKNYVRGVFEQFKLTPDFKKKKLSWMKMFLDSYVYDAYSETLQQVEFGDHFKAIKEFVINYLLKEGNVTEEQREVLKCRFIPSDLYPLADKYIEKYIEMKKTFNLDKSYRFQHGVKGKTL